MDVIVATPPDQFRPSDLPLLAAYAAQEAALKLRPWQALPCWVHDIDAALALSPDDHRGRRACTLKKKKSVAAPRVRQHGRNEIGDGMLNRHHGGAAAIPQSFLWHVQACNGVKAGRRNVMR